MRDNICVSLKRPYRLQLAPINAVLYFGWPFHDRKMSPTVRTLVHTFEGAWVRPRHIWSTHPPVPPSDRSLDIQQNDCTVCDLCCHHTFLALIETTLLRLERSQSVWQRQSASLLASPIGAPEWVLRKAHEPLPKCATWQLPFNCNWSLFIIPMVSWKIDWNGCKKMTTLWSNCLINSN